MVVALSASLNVAVGAVLAGWPVAPLAGVVAVTVGGVVSGGGPPDDVLTSTVTSPESQFAVATSLSPSPSKSAVITENGVWPTVNVVPAPRPPVPEPTRTVIVFPPGWQ